VNAPLPIEFVSSTNRHSARSFSEYSLGFCQELGISSVLTTEVINWCRSAVRELGLARRLVAQAARRVAEEGAVATYLHATSNAASAKVAEAGSSRITRLSLMEPRLFRQQVRQELTSHSVRLRPPLQNRRPGNN